MSTYAVQFALIVVWSIYGIATTFALWRSNLISRDRQARINELEYALARQPVKEENR